MIVRYYQTNSGRRVVEEFVSELPESTRLEFVDAINLLAEGQSLSMPLSRNLSSIRPGLHELRFRDKAGQVRVFYFIKRGIAIYLVHACRKKSQQIQKSDIELILKRIKEL